MGRIEVLPLFLIATGIGATLFALLYLLFF